MGTSFVNVVTDTSGLEDSLSDALQKGFSGAKFGGLVGATATGIAAVVREFAPLEKELNRIFQIQGVDFSESMFTQLATQVTDIADRVGLRAEPIGAAIAAGVGRGFSQKFSAVLAEEAGNLAVATNSEVAPAIQALTGVINAYGKEVLSVDHASEVLFETMNFTGQSLADIARQIGNITPAAAHAGVSLDEVGAAIATMTSQGLTLAESTTQMRTLFTELNTSASKGAKVFKAISGKTFPEFIKAGGDLRGAVELIAKASEGANVPISDLFGNVNSGNAVLALTGGAAELFGQRLAETAKDVGSMDKAVDTANQGSLRRFQDATAGIHTSLDRLGLAIRPLTKAIEVQLIRVLDGVSGAFNMLAAKLQGADFSPIIAAVSWLGDNLAELGGHFMTIFQGILAIDWTEIGQAIKVGFAPLAIVIPLIIDAVGLLATAFTNYLVPAINAVLPFVTPIVAAFSLLFGAFASGVAVVGAIGIAFLIFGKILMKLRALIFLLRGAWVAFTVLFATNPLGAILLALAALATAFVYAWKNSEKFRDIVRSVFINVVDVVGTAVNGLITLASMWVKAYLYGFKAILDGLAHLPDWLGGGVAKDASSAVQRVIDGVNAIEDSLHGLVNTAVNAAKALAMVVDVQNEGFGTQGLDEVYAQLAKDYPNGVGNGPTKAPKLNLGGGMSPNLGALDDVLNPKKADKSAKKAADAAKKRLAELLPDIYDAARKLAKNIGDKSLSSIQSGFESLIGKYTTAIEMAGEQGNKVLVARLKLNLKLVKNFEKTLESLAKKRDAAIAKLDSAKTALKAIKDEAASFSKSLKDAFVNIGSVATASAGIDVTFRGIRNNLKNAITIATQFNTAMVALQKLNLNPASLRQLAEAGPAALEQAQALARSGASGVKEINNLQKTLDDMAGKNAANLTNEFFSAGVKAAEGLVKGLQSQRDAIIKEMTYIANAMVKAIKTGLKIHSPSQVFDEEIGRQIPAGMAQGVRRGTPDVMTALKAMTGGSGVNISGGINVSGVSDPAAARRSGILAGEGIKAVLESRATTRALAGV